MSGRWEGSKGVPSLLQHLRSLPDELIPTEGHLKELVNAHLVLTNKAIDRAAAVDRVVTLITGWYNRFGKDKAIQLIGRFLIGKLGGSNVANNGRGDGGDQSQLGDLPGLFAVARRGRPGANGESCIEVPACGRLQVIEGGRAQGSEEGAGAPECTAGGAHQSASEAGEGISKRLVELELAEHRIDLQVFQKAYSGIRARVRTVEDEGRLMKLATWSGTTASLGLLELVIHNIERVIGELEDILKKIEAGTIPNLDEE